jgi:hypothetical protein
MKSTFNQLQGLLDTSKNPSLNLIQTKWFRDLKEGNIEIKKDQVYRLSVTENKRIWVKNKKDKLLYTEPITIEDKSSDS